MRILLVDDEDGIREGLAGLLRLKGHEVRTAATIDAGRELLGACRFDLAITDWRLPDGTADLLFAACDLPVIAVSGHPEEVDRLGNLHRVMQKPVLPNELLQIVQQFAAACAAREAAAAAPAAPALPLDVADVVALATAILQPEPVAIEDDGGFVSVTARLSDDGQLEALERLGGDLCVRTPGGVRTVVLRCRRDGCPDGIDAVVTAGEPWPDVPQLAIDFDGSEPSPDDFVALLDLAAAAHAAGRVVQFLNTPRHLQFWAEVSGRGHDMPKRALPGPRIPALLSQLWS